MMMNKGNYLAAADHELECDILQVGGFIQIRAEQYQENWGN